MFYIIFQSISCYKMSISCIKKRGKMMMKLHQRQKYEKFFHYKKVLKLNISLNTIYLYHMKNIIVAVGIYQHQVGILFTSV
jgi:hypothetical protein